MLFARWWPICGFLVSIFLMIPCSILALCSISLLYWAPATLLAILSWSQNRPVFLQCFSYHLIRAVVLESSVMTPSCSRPSYLHNSARIKISRGFQWQSQDRKGCQIKSKDVKRCEVYCLLLDIVLNLMARMQSSEHSTWRGTKWGPSNRGTKCWAGFYFHTFPSIADTSQKIKP